MKYINSDIEGTEPFYGYIVFVFSIQRKNITHLVGS